MFSFLIFDSVQSMKVDFVSFLQSIKDGTNKYHDLFKS